ncbi:hypothetical protein [Aeromicrobium endophyticum]|uniref:Uncharacterized protein n=1 Tax=Aeromicrobium endophyticum TaxID=2292704 RepID=A0A371P8H8_9ACTN|nr:hypothetical protein [Aeromicrobium endophyticum]REK72202.1 hypothetical protein DX116_00710 [Aeromicrobium endophyticum]
MAGRGRGKDVTSGFAPWAAPESLTRLETIRADVEREVSTLKGFRRRVRQRGEWSLLPLLVGGPIMAWEVFRWGGTLIADADGDVGLTWRWFVDSPSVWWAAVAVVLLAIARVSIVTRIRREFRRFRREGWVAFQAPSGWVNLNTDGPSHVVHDHRSVGGAAQYRARDLGEPIVLVSAPGMRADAFVAVLEQVRADIVRRVHAKDQIEVFNQERKTLRAAPAARWFPAAAGCLLGEGDDRILTVAVPAPSKGGRRTRLGSIKLTRDEAQALEGGSSAAR